MLWSKYDEGARQAGKGPSGSPKMLQVHVSWARTDDEAAQSALVEWLNGGMPFPSMT